MKTEILRDLLETQIQQLYISESLIIQSISAMQSHVSNDDLNMIINAHTQITYEQQTRLYEIGKYLKIKLHLDDRRIIKALIQEIDDVYKVTSPGLLMDLSIVAKLQHIQHFQIATYENTLLYAKSLSLTEIELILETTLY